LGKGGRSREERKTGEEIKRKYTQDRRGKEEGERSGLENRF
jgi:hypothetical protein